jgi:hypothetical protein
VKSEENKRKKQEKNKNKQLLFKEKQKKYGQGLHCKSFNSNVEKVCDLGNMNLECSYCKAMGFNCENKGTISNPHFGRICCNKGHIILKQFPVLPQKLLDLLNNNDVLSQYYQKHIRKFNSAMAMASFQAPHEVKPRGTPSSFKIQGQVYRRMGCIRNRPGEAPRCIQTYFYDSSEQALIRTYQMARAKNCNIEFDKKLFFMLEEILKDVHNTYLTAFLQIKELIHEKKLNPDEVKVCIENTPVNTKTLYLQQHRGRYNIPTAPEVSILMPTDLPPETTSRQVVISYRDAIGDEQLRSFPDYSGSYDPLQYPLIFPYGTNGWHLKYQTSQSNKCTLNQYIRFHLMIHTHIFNILHAQRKLFQQYLVDQFCRVECMRLRYIRDNQKSLRADLYTGVIDSINKGDTQQSGKHIILPPSFTGSDRYMHEGFQNAMALVREFGKPDFFITMC